MPFIDTNEFEVREPRPGWKGRFGESRHTAPGSHGVRALTHGRAIVVDHPVRLEIGGARIE